jgi:hypothetical protein
VVTAVVTFVIVMTVLCCFAVFGTLARCFHDVAA